MQWFSIRFPQGLAKAFTLSYDDGVVQDRRFIGLLKKYDLRGTFNLNSKRCGQSYIASLNGCRRERLKYEEWKDLYELPYAEAAIHGAEHCHILDTPLSALIPEFFEDRRVLEETFGYMVRGGAYPYGDVSDEAIALMRSMGIYYMRTAKSTLSFDPPHGDLMRFDGTCHHDNPKLFELAEKFIGTEPQLNPYLFYVWGHTYEFDEKNNWDRIERFFEMISGKKDVWYARNSEIFDYITAFSQLVFSADGSTVKNPTDTDLWAVCDGKKLFLPKWQTTEI